jgi:ubiquinone/menaquinone biosynthesis C-methylase UbiE
MNEYELLVDLHKNLERLGPGDEAETLKALELTGIDKTKKLKVADIGCGTGASTFTLAKQLINAEIIAVDLFDVFLDSLNKRAKTLGLNSKINTLCLSMEELPFNEKEFDLIWSEGAIYSVGFENAIKCLKPFLKAGAKFAFTEVTWLTDIRPNEINEFWNKAYPEIDTFENKCKVLEENGLKVVGSFPLPKSCWMDNYYSPLTSEFDDFLKRHGTEEAENLVSETKSEISLYDRFSDYYGYYFYIATLSTPEV